MSFYDYKKSSEIASDSHSSFYSIIMAAMRRADDTNMDKLKECWPDVFQELQERYNARGGILPKDNIE